MNNRKAYKILFLDDDQFILQMYGVKFAQTEHELKFASSADEAMKILKDGFKPDALVFDVIMPEVQGFDFVSEAKKEGLLKDVVTIALTNQGELEDYNRAEQLHVDEYIIKANHIPSEVVAMIEYSINKNKEN